MKEFNFYIQIEDRDDDFNTDINEQYVGWLEERGIKGRVCRPSGLGASTETISFIMKIIFKVIGVLKFIWSIYLRVSNRDTISVLKQYNPRLKIYIWSDESKGDTLGTRQSLSIAQKMKEDIYLRFSRIYEVDIVSISNTNYCGRPNTLWVNISKRDFSDYDLGRLIKKINKIKATNKTIYIDVTESFFIKVRNN